MGKKVSFETVRNRSKFEILGKKVKGKAGSSKRTRDAGTNKRKDTLLVELLQSRRNNTFVDRRIGEHDAELTADDKAIARFQRQRLKDLQGQKYNLADQEPEDLVDFNIDEHGNEGWARDSEDELGDELFTKAHFGGGDPEDRDEKGSEPAAEQPRSKKEIMEEIIAKSKSYKAEKAKQRDEDLEATEALDQELAALQQSGALHGLIGPKGRARLPAATDDVEVLFDRDRRELIYEAKAKAGSRTMTQEETARREAKILEVQESNRRKRMLDADVGGDGPQEVEEEGVPLGGYAQRRAKRAKRAGPSGDALEDDFEAASDSEAGSASEDEQRGEARPKGAKLNLDQRRQQRAAGDHPLQEQFRAAAAELLAKHGVQPTAGEKAPARLEGDAEAEDSASTSEDGSASGSEDGSEEGSQGMESAEGEASGGGIEGDSKGERTGAAQLPGLQARTPVATSTRAQTPVATSTPVQTPVATSTRAQAPVATSTPAVNMAPASAMESYGAFSSSLEGKHGVELGESLRQFARHVTSGGQARPAVQVFFGYLVQHFADRSGTVPPLMADLDVLAVSILNLTPEVPLFAATTALARLQRLQDRLQLTLTGETDPTDSKTGWPTQRQLLLLKLWATIFPASDRRHPVLTPAAVTIGAYLSLCPVQSVEDVRAGLFLSSLALQMAATATRWIPEPLTFVAGFLSSLLPEHRSRGRDETRQFSAFAPPGAWLSSGEPPRLSFELASEQSPHACLSCLAAALELCARSAEIFSKNAALPAMLDPVAALLPRLRSLKLPESVERRRAEVLASVTERIERIETGRTPLRKAKLRKEVKLYNPRFEDDFTAGRDYDPDREKAEARKLKRQLVKERRGAVRELRRDAAFLGAEHRKEKDAGRREIKAGLQKNNTWLQKLESDLKSGGQGGMWKKKKQRK